MVHASTLSAILYSAAAASNLISASSSSSAHESSDLNFPPSDVLLVAHLPFLQLLRDHLSSHDPPRSVVQPAVIQRGETLPRTREKFRQRQNSLILRVIYSFVSVRCG